MTRPDDRLTVAEVAALAGIKPGTFRVYVHREQAPAADGHIDKRTPFWYGSTIEEWIRNRPRAARSG